MRRSSGSTRSSTACGRRGGAFPGLGSALSAFGYEWGFQHGSLLAYEIELLREREGGGDPWKLVDAVMDDPAKLGGPVAKLLTGRAVHGLEAPLRRAAIPARTPRPLRHLGGSGAPHVRHYRAGGGRHRGQ